MFINDDYLNSILRKMIIHKLHTTCLCRLKINQVLFMQ